MRVIKGEHAGESVLVQFFATDALHEGAQFRFRGVGARGIVFDGFELGEVAIAGIPVDRDVHAGELIFGALAGPLRLVGEAGGEDRFVEIVQREVHFLLRTPFVPCRSRSSYHRSML